MDCRCLIVIIIPGIVCGGIDDDDGVCEVANAYVCECTLKSECFMEVNVEWLMRLACFFLEIIDCGDEFLGSGACMI